MNELLNMSEDVLQLNKDKRHYSLGFAVLLDKEKTYRWRLTIVLLFIRITMLFEKKIKAKGLEYFKELDKRLLED